MRMFDAAKQQPPWTEPSRVGGLGALGRRLSASSVGVARLVGLVARGRAAPPRGSEPPVAVRSGLMLLGSVGGTTRWCSLTKNDSIDDCGVAF